jgi:hypothetical protein
MIARASHLLAKESKTVPLQVVVSSAGRRSLWIGAITFLLLTINFMLQRPGEMNPDAVVQYGEAISGHFTDWHPPVMAYVWSLLLHIAHGPQPMLALHLIFYWLGFALLADGLARSGRTKAGWLMLALGACPLFFYYNGSILKDVGLVAASIAGFGLVFWHRIQNRRPPLAIVAAALVLIAYGALVRANAVFAFAPLLLYAVVDPIRIDARRLIILVAVLSAAAIPVSNLINRNLFRATPSGSLQSLQLFDLAGIARNSGDLSVLSAARVSAADIDRCYTPYWWDSLSPWGQCKFIFERLGASTTAPRPALTKLWEDAIIAHPLAYAEHRLKVFNSMMYFFVPAKHCRLVESCGVPGRMPGVKLQASPQDIRLDYLKKSIFVWPATWMALGVCMVALLRLSPTPAPLAASRTLLVSGLGYSLGYLIVGVATDVRYHYWSIVAILTALIVAFPLLVARIRKMDRTVVACAVLLALVLGMGLYARLADNQLLVA